MNIHFHTADPLADVSPVLAGLASASVQGRVALGPRAGARVRRLGDEPDLGHVTSGLGEELAPRGRDLLCERRGARRLEPLVGQGGLCFWHHCFRGA